MAVRFTQSFTTAQFKAFFEHLEVLTMYLVTQTTQKTVKFRFNSASNMCFTTNLAVLLTSFFFGELAIIFWNKTWKKLN